MKINLDEIPENGLELSFHGNEDILASAIAARHKEKGISINTNIQGKLFISKSDKDFLITGNVDTAAKLDCSRCLEQFSFKTNLNISSIIVIRKTKLDEQDTDQSESIYVVDTPEFDPGELILQELFLEIPMKPLCDENCPGFCQICGQPHCQGHSSSEKKSDHDPRWSKLAEIKTKIDSD